MITHYKKEGFEILLIMEAWESSHVFYIKYQDFRRIPRPFLFGVNEKSSGLATWIDIWKNWQK